jgi:hypothetical protein
MAPSLRLFANEPGQSIHIAYSLDGFLRASAVPVISVPFALGRPATSAVHPANAPAPYRGRMARLSRPL